MHVLVLPSSYPTPGNPARGCFYREQAQALARAGVQVGVVAPVFRGLRTLTRERWQRSTGLFIGNDAGVQTVRRELWARFSPSPRLHGRHWLRVGRDLYRRYVDRFGVPDLIHAHGAYPAGRLAAAIAERDAIPFVLTEHSTAFARNSFRPWQDAIIRRVLRAAAVRIAVSPQLANLLESRFPSDASAWQTIPNLVAPDFQPTGKETREAIQTPFRFLNVALLTEKKSHDTLLHATAHLLARGTAVELRIVGDGPLRGSLTRLADRLGIASHVSFAGAFDRAGVVAEMQSADAFVLSSRHETFGVVVVEALATGLPVVATICGGPESIVGPQDGLLVPADNVAALAEGMLQIIAQRAEYPAAALQRRCRERFGEQAVIRQITDVYSRVVGRLPAIEPQEAA
jgi:teichuronic acid biosynthesis glycosyltransferase TuaC